MVWIPNGCVLTAAYHNFEIVAFTDNSRLYSQKQPTEPHDRGAVQLVEEMEIKHGLLILRISRSETKPGVLIAL